MRYLPHTFEDIEAMLQTIGLTNLNDLFPTIPSSCRIEKDLELLDPLTEWELNKHMKSLSDKMANSQEYTVFLGAGSYEHYLPASIQYLISRSELATAYTPYQPEISQGTLQAIFEYQTLVSALLGMEVSNASMYDGASALAEALFMSLRISRNKNTVAISKLIHPTYRRVIHTYFEPTDFKIVELPYLKNGRTDISPLKEIEDLAAVAIQSPNFFGCIEDLHLVHNLAEQLKAIFITSFTEPLAYGILKNPGSQGADIVCGEGQSLGISQSYGGPGLGIFCTKNKYVRKMPGRLVGETQDKDGQKGYVLTLATREQHIRREKATSNICSNQSLCATLVAMYLASVGGSGLQKLAALNRDKSEYLKKRLQQAECNIPFNSPTFNEFVVKFPDDFKQKYQKLIKKKIIPGLDLSPYYPELAGYYLLCVTETKTKEDLDMLVKEVTA